MAEGQDLLTQLNTNVKNLVDRFESLPCEKQSEKVDEKMDRGSFWKILGILVTAGLIIFGGISGYNFAMDNASNIKIEENGREILQHKTKDEAQWEVQTQQFEELKQLIREK